MIIYSEGIRFQFLTTFNEAAVGTKDKTTSESILILITTTMTSHERLNYEVDL